MYILMESLIFQDEYAEALAVIERSILATDLALHFRDAQALSKLATSIVCAPCIADTNEGHDHFFEIQFSYIDPLMLDMFCLI